VTSGAAPSAEGIVGALRSHGITHVLGIPDNTSAPLFDSLADAEPPRLIMVTREGEAFAMAAGLWLGGCKPLVVTQNCGLLEAGDALRGTAVRMAVPLPVIVTGRGYAKMEKAGLSPLEPLTPHLLTRPDLDSVAFLTEPTLDAWGIPWTRCGGDDDPAAAVAALLDKAEDEARPVALVLTRSMC
jgi:sulfopyruvate decarboxylase TPP-binding subunit